MVHITSKINPDFTWKIKNNAPITPEDRAFIKAFDPTVYHNDIECYLWSFDERLPSGAWIENIRFAYDMKSAQAYIYYKEANTCC